MNQRYSPSIAHPCTESISLMFNLYCCWYGYQYTAHNMAEVVSACLAMIDDPDITVHG